jgi:Transglutaminase-like superfamily
LPPRERLLLVRYVAMVVGLEVALRFATPGRLVPAWAATARWAPARRGSGVSWPRRERLAARAAAAVRPGRACLPEALLLWREALAAREGARLIIGVRTTPAFSAHAWVERPDGTVLGGGREPEAGLARLAVWGPDGEPSPGRG